MSIWFGVNFMFSEQIINVRNAKKKTHRYFVFSNGIIDSIFASGYRFYCNCCCCFIVFQLNVMKKTINQWENIWKAKTYLKMSGHHLLGPFFNYLFCVWIDFWFGIWFVWFIYFIFFFLIRFWNLDFMYCFIHFDEGNAVKKKLIDFKKGKEIRIL